MLKHDIENSSMTITQLSKSIAPAIKDMVEYVRSQKAYNIVSEAQLKILERSMHTIAEEAERLAFLAKKAISEQMGGGHNDM